MASLKQDEHDYLQTSQKHDLLISRYKLSFFNCYYHAEIELWIELKNINRNI